MSKPTLKLPLFLAVRHNSLSTNGVNTIATVQGTNIIERCRNESIGLGISLIGYYPNTLRMGIDMAAVIREGPTLELTEIAIPRVLAKVSPLRSQLWRQVWQR